MIFRSRLKYHAAPCAILPEYIDYTYMVIYDGKPTKVGMVMKKEFPWKI